ncbi:MULTISPECIES: H-NS histone family protein [Delftia]|jgi:DNA-binding protein H-NS|uniref:H-NS histone family protein n=1 Tax=Delftia deserti TaxID=1651218 RepID=A0ABW5EN86_9BURK|nr:MULTISPECIES: H-NS histone family protein [Delftia]PZR26812.1 MAG: H-NS histone family protein [Azospira oryzae]MDH0421164.1 H-NS histone family protein [Delftia tsuruhatensis]MDH2234516.1 H-NS histone family protein [Delftia tsuruhatensis]QFS63546.1 H-NS histone family protein [Delftia tsuruhatensis]WAT86364.1 H-NS histone family protein [Delftia acidovorans]
MTVDYKALLQQKAELEAKIAQALAAEKAGVLARVRSLVADYKLSAEDVFGGSKRKMGTGTPKYRDPATGSTWTGRGKPPTWIKGIADRSSFEI